MYIYIYTHSYIHMYIYIYIYMHIYISARQVTSSFALMSALDARSALIAASCPSLAAKCSGVSPFCVWCSFGHFTQIGHIPGGGRPLWREGGPISYEPRPSASFRPLPPNPT